MMTNNCIEPYDNWNWDIWLPHRSMAWHKHSFLQTIHVIDGALEIDWGNGWQTCGPGEIHILPPQHTHQLRSPHGHRQFGLNWQSVFDERGTLKLALEMISEPLIVAVPQALHDLDPLTNPNLSHSATKRLTIGSSIDAYVSQILKAVERHAEGLWQQCLALVDQCLDRNMRVSDLCSALGYSRTHIQRLSQQHARCGIIELHAQRRCLSAAYHLIHFPGTIAGCAERFGFIDQASFSRYFKRHMGLSPRSYRQSRRSGLCSQADDALMCKI